MLLGLTGHRNMFFVGGGEEETSDVMSWLAAAPAAAGGVSAGLQAQAAVSNRFVTSQMNLNVLSCESISLGGVQVPCVPGSVPACSVLCWGCRGCLGCVAGCYSR